jgi:hypothetical protein
MEGAALQVGKVLEEGRCGIRNQLGEIMKANQYILGSRLGSFH